MKIVFIGFSLLFSIYCHAANVSVRLVIKNGTLSFNDGSSVPYKIYTSETDFPKNSDLLIWNTGDIITLKVVNEDSEIHGFLIEGNVDYGNILPGDSVEQVFTLIQEGVFRYYDPLNSPYNQYLGLAGIVHVKSPIDLIPYFYWDLREHQELWNTEIILGNSPIINQYDPFYFTINGNSDPDINSDAIARVTGNVGNEVRIVIVNNGMSIHSMHFHGYHAILVKIQKIRITKEGKKILFHYTRKNT